MLTRLDKHTSQHHSLQCCSHTVPKIQDNMEELRCHCHLHSELESVMLLWGEAFLKNVELQCGSLNENGPVGSYVGMLTSTVGGTVWEGLEYMVLLEEVSHLGDF